MSSKRKAPINPASSMRSSARQADQPAGARSTSKRARFAEPLKDAAFGSSSRFDGDMGSGASEPIEGDPELEAQDAKREQQGRKGRVITEGYSDSEESEGGDDDVVSARKGKGKAAGAEEEEEDDDMFDVKGGGSDSEKEDLGGKKGKGKGKGKEPRFLEMGEIEGQEFGAASDRRYDKGKETAPGEDDEEASDLEVNFEDESEHSDVDLEAEPEEANEGEGDEASKGDGQRTKRKQGMGFKLDAFNMKAEMSAGRFDTEGNYIANAKDPHDQHDQWLKGNYSRQTIRQAKEAAKAREERAERERREMEERTGGLLNEAQKMMKLIRLMHRGETVQEAVQRIGAEAQKERKAEQALKKGAWGKGKRAQAKKSRSADATGSSDAMAVDDVPPSDMDVAAAASTSPSSAAPRHPSLLALDTVTDLTSGLMSDHGLMNIYDETFEGLVRSIRRSGEVPETWDPRPADEDESERERSERMDMNGAANVVGATSSDVDERQFEYKWAPSYLAAQAAQTGRPVDPEVQVYGPFSASDLKSWGSQGFFGGEGRERILLRAAAQKDGGGMQGGGWKRWGEAGL